jgi:hypothetical protein
VQRVLRLRPSSDPAGEPACRQAAGNSVNDPIERLLGCVLPLKRIDRVTAESMENVFMQLPVPFSSEPRQKSLSVLLPSTPVVRATTSKLMSDSGALVTVHVTTKFVVVPLREVSVEPQVRLAL